MLPKAKCHASEWDVAAFKDALPDEVRAVPGLVQHLIDEVDTTRLAKAIGAAGRKSPSERDLQTLINTAHGFLGALQRTGMLDDLITSWCALGRGGAVQLAEDVATVGLLAGRHLQRLQSERLCSEGKGDSRCPRCGDRMHVGGRPGPRPDHRRQRLEEHVYIQLVEAGLRPTKYRAGTLARTLIECLDAAGFERPDEDTLHPRLRTLIDSHGPRALKHKRALRLAERSGG